MILKGFNMGVNRAAIVTLVCCVLYNFCKIHSKGVPLPVDVEYCRDIYVGLYMDAMRLASDGQAAKIACEMMRAVFFQSKVEKTQHCDDYYIILPTIFLFGVKFYVFAI
jgi:hypothetical protein